MSGLVLRTVAVALMGVAGFAVGRGRSDSQEVVGDASSELRAGGGHRGLSALGERVSLPTGGSVFDIAMAIAGQVDEGGPGRFGEVWDALAGLPPGRRERVQKLVVDWWARAAPEDALETLEDGWRYRIYRVWAEGAPEAAWEHIRLQTPEDDRDSLGEEMITGMARTDREAAIAFARQNELGFDTNFFGEWLESSTGGVVEVAERMIAGAGRGIFDGRDFDRLLNRTNDEDEETLFELVAAESGEWRDYAMSDLIDEMIEKKPVEMMRRAMEDPAWLGGYTNTERMFENWRGEESEAARVWFESLEPDAPIRAELAAEFLDAGMFRSAEQAVEVLALVPEERRETAVYDVAAYYLPDSIKPQTIGARLEWVERWRFELGAKNFRRAIGNQIDRVDIEDLDEVEEVEAALAFVEPYDRRYEVLERFGYGAPEVATPWMMETMSPQERAPHLATAFENLLEDEPEQALALFPTLTEPGDIAALQIAIAEASVEKEDEEAARAIYERLVE